MSPSSMLTVALNSCGFPLQPETASSPLLWRTSWRPAARDCNSVVMYEGPRDCRKSLLLAKIPYSLQWSSLTYKSAENQVKMGASVLALFCRNISFALRDAEWLHYVIQALLAFLLSVGKCKGCTDCERVILSRTTCWGESPCLLNDCLSGQGVRSCNNFHVEISVRLEKPRAEISGTRHIGSSQHVWVSNIIDWMCQSFLPISEHSPR